MPLSVYYSIAEKLSPERSDNYYMYIRVKTGQEQDIAVTETITGLCESVMAQEDIYITSIETEKKDNAVGSRAMEAVVDCIGILLALIGVSNTLSAVYHMMILAVMLTGNRFVTVCVFLTFVLYDLCLQGQIGTLKRIFLRPIPNII